MERREIDPWPWSVDMGFHQAVEVTSGQRTLYCSGQTAMDGKGTPLHAGDLVAQYDLALDNLLAVLAEAGMGPSNVARLNVYLTDVDAFLGVMGTVAQRMADAGIVTSSTLLGVQRLALPELMVELEATAVA